MRRVIVALGLAAIAPPAFASPYVSLNFGEASYEIDCAAGLSCDEKDKAHKFALGWQFNRHLAAEAAYTDLGQADLSGPGFGAYLHASAYELSAVGTFPLHGIFSALGRLGIAYGKSKFGRDLSGEETSTALTFGAGLQLDFTKNVAVRLQWQRFDVEGDVDTFMFGLVLYPR